MKTCFQLLGHKIPRGEIAGSHDNSAFNFLGSYQTVFNWSYTILHSYQQSMWWGLFTFSSILRTFHTFVLLCSQGCSHPMDMKWYVTVDLFCIFLMTNEAEYFSMCRNIYASSLEKNVFKSFTHILIVLFCSSVLRLQIVRPLRDFNFSLVL